MAIEHLDVIIVGAGLSGIGAAWHLQDKCPSKTYTILESRDAIGGTWDLFRYPGVRSDSDMFTLGYNFKPWTGTKIIADGASIREYIRETARENGIDKKIQYGVKVLSADWSDDTASWTVTTEQTVNGKKKKVKLTCNFLMSCAGYYNYEKGHDPQFEGQDDFKGDIVHQQKWPEDLDYSNKKVVIIGSGATAVTLVPEMAKTAEHVTMLQRSPTYMGTIPAEDALSNQLRKFLPDMLVYRMGRTRNVLFQMGVFQLAQRQPKLMRGVLQGLVKTQLRGSVDMKHFTPKYNPWDQRLCAIPNGDLFKTMREGKADIVTDHIEKFVANGIQLKSGKVLEADIIVKATGLQIKLLGGVELSVNGEKVKMSEGMAYKGTMFENVPNAAMVFGYTNSSWTLRADLISEFVCRLLNQFDKTGATKVVPVNKDPSVKTVPFFDMNSGYIQRAKGMLPMQGTKGPWRVFMNYALDIPSLRFGKLNDGVLEFSAPQVEKAAVKTKKSA